MLNGRLRGVLEGRVVQIGDVAPDFQLPALVAGVKQTFRFSEYRERKNVVLAFYPSNWQESSARQVAEYQAQREKLLGLDAEVVAVCVDSIMNTTAWEREIGPIDFPLCSDFWPHGEVSALYGVLNESGADAGTAKRAIFVVGRDGRVAFEKFYAEDIAPPIGEVLDILEKL